MATSLPVENWHTYEASLWLMNDEPLYTLAKRCSKHPRPYARFLYFVGADTVPGNSFRWADKRIQRRIMNALIRDLE